ncbi:putative serine protease F56F10.1 [Diplonema papillatum]|nr:putative serine protease F56F10.1 [Diplonema papillatum]
MQRLALVACVAAVAQAAPSPFQVQRYERELFASQRAAKGGLKAGPPAEYVDQYQDHFDGSNENSWKQAFYTNATFWKGPASKAPIFLCVGGEGPAIDGTAVTGSVHCNVAVEWLPATGALMFALEHRYYGCHNSSACPVEDVYAKSSLRFLSSRQALADLARFVSLMNTQYNLTADNKWITWGGSYPGMLAGWARLKFPRLIHGSVASSAPVRAELNMEGYNDVVASAYSVADNDVGGSSACEQNIRDGHAQIGQMFTTEQGRQTLASLWGKTPEWYANKANQKSFAGNGVAYFPAQDNDPTCTSFACNIRLICLTMTNSSLGDNVHRLRHLTTQQDSWATRKWELAEVKDSLLTIPNYWGYQTCTEFAFYQTCDVGSNCFYTQGLVTLEGMDSFCKTEFNISQSLVARNVNYTNDYYGGDMPAGSCVLYPNGEVDPWHANSVLKQPAAGIPTLWVPGASHHAWTHPSASNDQPSVVQAREQIRQTVQQFLNQDCLQ